MVIDSSGEVGIGTTAPSTPLHIKGATASSGKLLIESATQTNNNKAVLLMAAPNVNNNTGNVSIECIHPNNQQSDLVIRTGATDSTTLGTERFRVDTAGNVGIGTKDNASVYDMHATGRTLQVDGPLISGRSTGSYSVGPRNTRDWFVYAGPSTNSYAYLHMKTDLWAGGSPAGNTQYTMSCFTYHSYYAYGGAQGQGSIGWHNWSGTYYNVQRINNGSLQLVQPSYVSTDGYVVLVALLGTGYAQFSIDWAQWGGYPFQAKEVTAVGQGAAATGVY
jgi:hypothetical protein